MSLTLNRYGEALVGSPVCLGATVVAGWLAVAMAYCYVHGYLESNGRPDLGVSVAWSLRSWGAWLLLAPVLVGLWQRPGTPISVRVLGALIALVLSVAVKLALETGGYGAARSLIQETYLFVPQSAALLFLIAAGDLLRRRRSPSKAQPAAVPGRFEIDTGDSVALVLEDDIRWVGAQGNYVELSDGQRHGRLRSTLTDFEAQLRSGRFHRVHRSFLVNIDFIADIEHVPGSRQSRVRLRGDDRAVPVSRQGLATLRKRLRGSSL